jgi:hypothetical protein
MCASMKVDSKPLEIKVKDIHWNLCFYFPLQDDAANSSVHDADI